MEMVGYIMLWTLPALLIIALGPWAMKALCKRFAVLDLLGSVFMCYALGLVLSFVFSAAEADMSLITTLYSVFVMLAIPLILFSADLGALRRLAKPMLLSFCLGTAAVIAVCVLGFFLFRNSFPQSRTAADISAMLIGMYTGGTPNTLAIGKALGAGETIMLVQTADIVSGGVYFLLLISALPRLLGRVLRPYQTPDKTLSGPAQDLTQEMQARGAGRPYFFGLMKALALAVVCVLIAVGAALALPPEAGAGRFANIDRYTAVIMLLATTLGVGLSFSKKVRALPGSYDAGQYLILMFSVGMGLCFDLSRLGEILLVIGVVFSIEAFTVILHVILARFARIDRDTMMITSVAGVFGPAFIIPVARALKNDEIILPGILCGILGYAIGNYLGIGIGSLLLALCRL